MCEIETVFSHLCMYMNMFSNETSCNETWITDSDTEVITCPLVTLIILFGLPVGVLLVVVPVVTVVVVLKNKRLRKKNNNVF